MFDQVLVRPDLLSGFDEKKTKIITKTNFCSLLTKTGIPNKSAISDHLPIFFSYTII